MSAAPKTKHLLAFRSGDRCAFPKCGKWLTVDAPGGGDPVVIGEAAHIAGDKPDAPRFDAAMTYDERDHYNNLIYLCGDHHTQIDKQVEHFPVALLTKMKTDHEAKVRDGMNDAFAEIGSPELRIATEWVYKVKPGTDLHDFSLLTPDAKILKNDLSLASRLTITMGLSVARLVSDFIQDEAQIDVDYPERLKAGFLTEYYRLRHDGFKGDDLFDMMCEFAQRGMIGQARRSAGLAVLVCLFEKCDVFEK